MSSRIASAPSGVRSLIRRCLPIVSLALRGIDALPVAAVVVAPGRDAALLVERTKAVLHEGPEGESVAVVPLAHAQALADELAPDVASALREPLELGHVWCLILRPPFGPVAAVIKPSRTSGPGSLN